MISFTNNSSIILHDFSHQEEIAWIESIILNENKTPGDINYIFCDDVYLHSINMDFLNHDTYTDIITFPTSTTPDIISCDIFISLERVKENSQKLSTNFNNEFHRVMAHGILHLVSYDDHTPEDIIIMRSKENYYVNLHP